MSGIRQFLDCDLAILVAQLILADINEIIATRSHEPSGRLAPADKDLALQVQADDARHLLQCYGDRRVASSLQRAIVTDVPLINTLSMVDLAAMDDHQAAIALSRGLPLPALTSRQESLQTMVLPPPPTSSSRPSLTIPSPSTDNCQDPHDYRYYRPYLADLMGSVTRDETPFPLHARELIWAESERGDRTCATLTLTAPPVPRPPANELRNMVALKTIRDNPDLFAVVTPIKVDVFESYLVGHPNRPFVESVCRALREGFWPWAETGDPALPTTYDHSRRRFRNRAHAAFVLEQRDAEVAKRRFSRAFGPDLLPGMYSSPIMVVLKPNSDKLRMVVDQSAEPHSLNSMIPKDQRSTHLDDLRDLGRALRLVRARHPNVRLVLWKSDVSLAYRQIPMHPLWQIRQVVTIDNNRHVDRCNQFGGSASGRCWGCFADLMLWIANEVKHIEDLRGYVDDQFSWDLERNMAWYEPYKKALPRKQVQLLELWDEVGIPHEERKQVWGVQLTILGFEVDPNRMTINLPLEERKDLVTTIRTFAQVGQTRQLREFQVVSGWINWSFYAYPRLRPGLSMLYAKMAGQTRPQEPVYVNSTMCMELRWIADHIETSDGLHILESTEWDADEADRKLYTDACLTGLGFWSPDDMRGYQVPFSAVEERAYDLDEASSPIFFLEALTVLAALVHAIEGASPPPSRVAIYCDNTNTVDMFNTLHAKPAYNRILIKAVDVSLAANVMFRVFYIPGDKNGVADALSRFQNHTALAAVPSLKIAAFRPPGFTLGATQQ